MGAEVDSRLGSVPAVRLNVAQLSHKGLRTVVTGLVKQVLQVLKELENRTKAKKNKSLVQVSQRHARDIYRISLKIGVELLMQQNFLEPAHCFTSNPS